MDPTHPGSRLRAFREARGLSLRKAAEQLHTAHPVLKEWEAGTQVPAPAFRTAIEVWTSGEIKAADWPLSLREREIVEKASQVVAAEPGPKKKAPESGKLPSDADETGPRKAMPDDEVAPRAATGTDGDDSG